MQTLISWESTLSTSLQLEPFPALYPLLSSGVDAVIPP